VKSFKSIASALILLGVWYIPKSTTILAAAQAPSGSIPVSPSPSVSSSPTASNTKRLKIEVEVSSTSEVLIEEGQKVAAQQIIVDRKTERASLTNQLQEVKLSIEKLKTAPKVSQVPPTNVSALRALPNAKYLEETAQVTAAAAKLQDTQRKYAVAQKVANAPLPETGQIRVSQQAIQQAEENIRKQQQKIDALANIEDLDPAVKQHEEAKIAQLRQKLTELQAKLEPEQQNLSVAAANRSSTLEAARFEVATAQRELELAKARLGAAKEKRQQTEVDYSYKQVEHGQQTQRLELERVKLLESGKLQEHDREYQLAQLILKHNQIQRQLEDLAAIKVPHAGTIRRVKLAGQRGGLLLYEITLVYQVGERDSKTKANTWKDETNVD
jgi:chromosome segregation ATPase